MLFGLFIALTFIGAVSVAEQGREQIRTLFLAALGCNLAWGLVDAVMYLVRTLAERGRLLTLARSVQAAHDAETGCRLIKRSLSQAASRLLSATEIEAVCKRILAMVSLPERPTLNRQDLLAAVAIFLIVVASTFPVVLPFLLISDVATAKNASRGIALVMMFFGGLALGRYAGHVSWKVGFSIAGLGAGLVLAINALGG
jgi:VIT1/CCC1 family predicted Fe2+/Mn2+ transporter